MNENTVTVSLSRYEDLLDIEARFSLLIDAAVRCVDDLGWKETSLRFDEDRLSAVFFTIAPGPFNSRMKTLKCEREALQEEACHAGDD